MENVINYLNEFGIEISAKHQVEIYEIAIDGNTATFESGECHKFLVEFTPRETTENDELEIIAEVNKLYTFIDLGDEHFIPVELHLDQKYSFVVNAISEYLSAKLLELKKKENESNYWGSLIDSKD